jgi:CBS domain-containing protein
MGKYNYQTIERGSLMQVSDVMTENVIKADENESITDVAKKMAQFDIGVLPVCNSDNLLGVITDRDITLRCVAAGRNTDTVKAREIMSSNAISISPTQNLQDAATIMAKAQYRRLPVTDNGKVVGILSIGDLARLSGYDMETARAFSEINEDKD